MGKPFSCLKVTEILLKVTEILLKVTEILLKVTEILLKVTEILLKVTLLTMCVLFNMVALYIYTVTMREITVSTLQKKNIVSQANALIEARYTITKNEQLLLFAMISLIEPKDRDFLTFSVTTDQLSEILNIHKATAIREFDKITDRLMSRVIKINTDDGWCKIHWVSRSELKNNTVSLRFHDDLKPFLLALKESGNFTQYRLEIAVQFRSAYTIRIYQLLKEYYSKRIYTFEFSLEDFRDMMLGDKSKAHPVFKNFRRHVLNVAQRELSEPNKALSTKEEKIYKSDLNFDLKTRRTGRKISHLIFTITCQQTKPTKVIDIPEEDKKDLTQIILDFHKFGLTTEQVKPFLKERGEEALKLTLAKIKADHEGGKIKSNVSAYAFKLLQENAGKKSPADEEKAKQRKLVEAKRQKEKRIKDLKDKFEKERNKTARESLEGMPKNIIDGLIKQFEMSGKFKKAIESEFTANAYKKHGINKQWGEVAFLGFIKENFLGEEFKSFENWLKFKGVKL